MSPDAERGRGAADPGFWEDPEVVARFAGREPDLRLRALVEEYPRPEEVRVLDAGCAGGRNTVFLAERGFDVHALDASEAMVAETRRRLGAVLGADEARRRVRPGRMDERSALADGSVDLVVSLGLLHNATSWEEWERAADETVRVLAPGGRLLISQFTPRTDLTGAGARPVPGSPHLWEGALPGGPAVLLETAELDEAMRAHGLRVETPTTVGEGGSDRGRRVSAKGLYRKPSAP